ncbi:MAG: sodium:solute symporter family protein [Bacteroidota bacterium]
MNLQTLDWSLIIGFFIVSLGIGFWTARTSGKNSSEFFLSGRNMPWWLLGISMVATTFSADTPNLVTDIVRKNGVAGNWVWWAFLLTGMLTVFVYARLWRRSGVLTDLEFYELRYSGKPAAFLRGFRAIYLGVFFNVMIMATVSLAAIKIGGVLLGLSPVQTVLIASVVTVIYSVAGGLRGVILTDFFQFIMAMIGTVWAAIVVVDLPEIGSLSNLLTHENVSGKLSLLPDFSNMDLLVPLFIIPIAVQWWSVWYPGAEPGGGGYVAQRMLAAKNEENAMGATLLFNIAHYALRPWPWIIIALCSLIIFPDMASIQAKFPHIDPNVVNDDLAYPAMLSYLPSGLLGLVIASLIAAYMSTISTHLNWGSSYVVNDWYKRFYNPEATDREQVMVGRISTVVLMVLSALLALLLSNALQAFNILLQIGAGTGLIFILRWFWWRINAYSEIAAMIISFVIALYFEFIHPEIFGGEPLADHVKLIAGITLTTIGWLVVTFATSPTERGTLVRFYKLIRPASGGWQPVIEEAQQNGEMTAQEVNPGKLPLQILGMLVGCFTVYAALFGTGFWLYGQTTGAAIAGLIAVGGGLSLFRIFGQLKDA